MRNCLVAPRSAFRFRDHIDPVLSETQRRLERLDQPRAIFLGDRDAVLNDLHPRAEPADFLLGVGADDLPVQPDPKISLLLDELEEITRFRLRRNGHPKGNQHRLVSELLRRTWSAMERARLGPDLPRAARAKSARHARPEQVSGNR